MTPLHRVILETIAYADASDRPLTEFEIWKLLLVSDGSGRDIRVSFREVREALRGSFLAKRTGRLDGFVFLAGRRSIVAVRRRRERVFVCNARIAKRIAGIMRYFPFVRMVCLTGSLSMKNADRESDIDLLVMLRTGHIWAGRAIATGVLHCFGLRRHGQHVARRACLNFWISSMSPEIRLKDIFSSNEYFFAIPLFGGRAFERFQSANHWIQRFRPNFALATLPHRYRSFDTRTTRLIRNIFEIFVAGLRVEGVLRKIQKRKILINPKSHTAGGTIEATDEALIFLPFPQGPRVFERFRNRLSNLEASISG